MEHSGIRVWEHGLFCILKGKGSHIAICPCFKTREKGASMAFAFAAQQTAVLVHRGYDTPWAWPRGAVGYMDRCAVQRTAVKGLALSLWCETWETRGQNQRCFKWPQCTVRLWPCERTDSDLARYFGILTVGSPAPLRMTRYSGQEGKTACIPSLFNHRAQLLRLCISHQLRCSRGQLATGILRLQADC